MGHQKILMANLVLGRLINRLMNCIAMHVPHLIAFSVLIAQHARAEENAVVKVFPVKASQGVAVDKKHFYAISNTKIIKHDKQTGQKITSWAANSQEGTQAHFHHINSGTVIDGKLYAAHSRFPIAPNDNSVEIFGIDGEIIKHESTIRMPKEHGSLTWIDKKSDNSWWMCYAVYGMLNQRKTKLVKYRYEKGAFIEQQSWFFPQEVVEKWGLMSCSGGSWGNDGKLYVTGHDNGEVLVIAMDSDHLRYVRSEAVRGISGQAIAWDRFAERPTLWGIVKNKHVSLTYLPEKKAEGN